MARYFEFRDDRSEKFWEIELGTASLVTRWGKIGTNGQSKGKGFADDEAAQKAYGKLVAEKIKEGYVELQGNGGGTSPAPAGSSASAGKAAKGAPQKSEAAAGSVPAAKPRAKVLTDPAGTPVAVDLPANDWYRANWRKLPPIGEYKPPERPFDLEACLKRLQKIQKAHYCTNWGPARIDLSVGKAEAWFWVRAKYEWNYDKETDKILATLRQEEYDKPRGIGDIAALNDKHDFSWFSADFAILIYKLLGEEDFVVFMSGYASRKMRIAAETFAQGFREGIVPRMDELAKERFRELLRPTFKEFPWPQAVGEGAGGNYLLAAGLGMDEVLLPLVESWTPADYAVHNDELAKAVIFGLGDPRAAARHYRRLGLGFGNADELRAWLAHTEDAELDYAVERFVKHYDKDSVSSMAKLIARVQTERAVAPMLRILTESKAPLVAKEWLADDPARAIAGLVPIAAGDGPQTAAALSLLGTLNAEGHGEPIRAATAKLDSAAQEKLRLAIFENPEATAQPFADDELPAEIAAALNAPATAKLGWLSPGEMPAILIGKKRLSVEQIGRVLLAMHGGEQGKPPAIAIALKATADQAMIDRFAWKLFELWLGVGAPPKDKWAMYALGWLGGDAIALKLAPLVRAWPGESQHQRAVLGLDILRAIGTDTALMQLNGIAQKVPFKALKQRANECMNAIAESKGLTKSELEDRIIPDCGLDERGTKLFDFGPRSWSFALGAELKPMLRDAEGKFRDDLPKPNAKDDADKAAAAVEEWKLMKKQIKEIAKIQAARLEQAMVTGRRWKAGDFQLLIVNHPLMINIARLVVWAGYSETGGFVRSFRVTDERDYADCRDKAVTLDGCAAVGVIHPLNLSDEEKKAWGELFADYALIPPFAQLGRAVYELRPGQEKDDDLGEITGKSFAAPSLVYTLEKLGWSRGVAMDAGCFDEHSKQFPAAGVTAVASYEGSVGMGYIQPDESLKVVGLYFVNGMREPSGYESKEARVKLGQVDRVVLSEVLYDLSVLAAKAQ
jgi:predicted DNA-binding WGR domain protein